MEVIIRPDEAAATDLVARLIVARIEAKPDCVLGLATGRTMERLYARLVQRIGEHDLSLRRCRTFNLDEYIGLPATDTNSYHQFMRHHLFDHVDLNPENTHVPDGVAADHAVEAERFEQAIKNAGGIDLQLLGIGTAGHIGFNEPLSALTSRTRVKTLTPATIAQNADAFGGDPERVPKRALTMGVGTILEAREIILLATGVSKADIVAEAVEGPLRSMITASALQLHPNCKVVLDEDGAKGLSGRDYYDFVFANEPEWRSYRE